MQRLKDPVCIILLKFWMSNCVNKYPQYDNWYILYSN